MFGMYKLERCKRSLLTFNSLDIICVALKRSLFYSEKIISDMFFFCWNPLRKKCSYSEIYWSGFSYIRTEYREISNISPYSVRTLENTDQKKFRTRKLFTQWPYFFFLLSVVDYTYLQKQIHAFKIILVKSCSEST